MNKPTNAHIAKFFGCTVEQVQLQHRKNASELSGMADKAQRTGRKVSHYTEAQLRDMASGCAKRATEQ